jgi:hypothetical protein
MAAATAAACTSDTSGALSERAAGAAPGLDVCQMTVQLAAN